MVRIIAQNKRSFVNAVILGNLSHIFQRDKVNIIQEITLRPLQFSELIEISCFVSSFNGSLHEDANPAEIHYRKGIDYVLIEYRKKSLVDKRLSIQFDL